MADMRPQSIFYRISGLFTKESFPVLRKISPKIKYVLRAFSLFIDISMKRIGRYPEEAFLSTIVLGTIGFYFLYVAPPPIFWGDQNQKNISLELVQSVFAGDSNDDSEQAVFSGVVSPLNPEYYDAQGENDSLLDTMITDDALYAGSVPLMIMTDRDGIITYSVRKGDTVQEIATSFGVSVDTIRWANNLGIREKLHQGQELSILPTTGIRYQVKSAETVENIAERYGVDTADIIHFNKLVFGTIKEGDVLIIPGAEGVYTKQSVSSSKMEPVNIRGYFGAPTIGHNYGILHPKNAVDIANVCGTTIVAAAEGLVVEAKSGWNGGYGNYIKIEHPNGVFTRYGHLASMAVAYGDYVSKGELLGLMGNTGKATGCHLHFEVVGARNPFAK